MSQLDSNQRPTFEQGCSTAELCSYPTYDVLTRWFRMLLTSGMPHAVSASRRETLLRCLSGPRHCRPKRISDRAPCAPQTARPPLAANLGPSDYPHPLAQGAPPCGVGHPPWPGPQPRIGFARLMLRERPLRFAPTPFRALSRHPASQRDQPPSWTSGTSGATPRFRIACLPAGHRPFRVPAELRIRVRSADPIPAFRPISTHLAMRKPPERRG